jgi:hypothetical protein
MTTAIIGEASTDSPIRAAITSRPPNVSPNQEPYITPAATRHRRCPNGYGRVCGAESPGIGGSSTEGRREGMLWLILGIILLAIAIAGGAIIHPVIFVLGIVAIFMAISGWRGRATI